MAWLLTFLLFGSRAFATCESYRLDGDGGACQRVRATDQANLEICYAHGMKNALDCWRFSHAPPLGDKNYHLQTSPLEGAIGHSVLTNPGEWGMDGTKDERLMSEDWGRQGGDGIKALEYWKRSGICPKSQVENGGDMDKSVKYAYYAYKKWQAKILAGNGLETIKLIQSAVKACQGFPDYTESEWQAALAEPTPQAFLHKLTKFQCQERQPIYRELKLKMTRISGQTNLFGWVANNLNALNQLMDQEQVPRQPVIALFNHKFLRGGRREQTDKITHSAIIIGRQMRDVKIGRKTERKCQVLLRNYWGTSCYGYDPEWTCEPGTGNIWVDAEVMAASTSYAGYLYDGAKEGSQP